jgi:hypothetical protein
VSEEQTWSSEDTRLLVSKSFWRRLAAPFAYRGHAAHLTVAAFSEAERIVFAAEGLFLAHAFPFYCGIRVDSAEKPPVHAIFDLNQIWSLFFLALATWQIDQKSEKGVFRRGYQKARTAGFTPYTMIDAARLGVDEIAGI